MRTIKTECVKVSSDRQRTAGKSGKDLVTLKKSIVHKGLLHPPVLYFAPNSDTEAMLIAGERRFNSMCELHDDSVPFKFEGEVVPHGTIPYTLLAELSDADRQEAELEENIIRLELPWPDQLKAKVRIHELRKAANPAQTQSDTAAEILEIKRLPVTETAIKSEQEALARARVVVSHLSMPSVAAASSPTKAYNTVLDFQKKQLERELLRITPDETPHQLILGDCREVMRTLDKGLFDVIFCDPPYGINAHKSGDLAIAHTYDDTPETAVAVCKDIIRKGFDLLKPKGALVMFCDIDHFLTLRLACEQMAYSTWRTPLIWHKGSEGHAPWGVDGFKRTYEILLYAVKGQRPMVLPGGPDVKTVVRHTRDPDRVHAAEKPPELLRLLLTHLCRVGDKVLDPCCGSGAIFAAAQGMGITVTGIELDPKTHALAQERMLTPGDKPEDLITHEQTIDDSIERLLAMGDE